MINYANENIDFHILIMPRYEWMTDLVCDIIDNTEQIFQYAKNNMKCVENYEVVKQITNLIKENFENLTL